jgi:hypothetical protein
MEVQMKGKILCGAARALITPDEKTMPFTYGVMNREFCKVHDDLFLRVIAIGNGQETSLIVSFDLDKATNPHVYIQKLSETTGVKAENILYFAIHTHSAPVTGPRPFERMHDPSSKPPMVQEGTKQYEIFVLEQLLAAAKEAIHKMRPAKIGCNSGKSFINVNRNQEYRVKKDHKETSVLDLGAREEGSVDRRVFAMKIVDDSGKVIATFTNYAVHNVAMFLNDCGNGKSAISADIGGNISKCLEDEYKESVSIWSSGAAGDLNPVLMGQMLFPDLKTGESFEQCVSDIKDSALILDCMTGRLLADTREALGGIESYAEIAEINGVIDYAKTPANPALAKELTGEAPSTYDIRLHLLQIGNIALIGVNGELYSSLGKILMDSSPLKHTVVINHESSMVAGNPGYILDDETVLRGQKAGAVKIPGGTRFRGLPGYIGPALIRCINTMFGTKESI